MVSEGQEVEVKVLSVDAEKQRISLSLKALQDRPVKPGQEKNGRRRPALPAGRAEAAAEDEPSRSRAARAGRVAARSLG